MSSHARRKNSPYKLVTDLRGKRIGIGLQASGAKVGAVLILEAHGMIENKDYQAEYLNSQQSIDRMRDNQLESMITVTGYPQRRHSCRHLRGNRPRHTNAHRGRAVAGLLGC